MQNRDLQSENDFHMWRCQNLMTVQREGVPFIQRIRAILIKIFKCEKHWNTANKFIRKHKKQCQMLQSLRKKQQHKSHKS